MTGDEVIGVVNKWGAQATNIVCQGHPFKGGATLTGENGESSEGLVGTMYFKECPFCNEVIN